MTWRQYGDNLPTGTERSQPGAVVDEDSQPATTPEPGAQVESRPRLEDGAPAAPTRKLPLVLGVISIFLLALGVTAVALFQGPLAAEGSPALESVPVAPTPTPSVERTMTSPRWISPAWADPASGLTAFELPAGNDVPFASGRLRPSLGITCAEGETHVYVITGGTAMIDPQTGGHMVRLTFDGTSSGVQQWVAADDQRSLLAPDPLAFAARIAAARHLELEFSHYMAGSVGVEFNLRGAGDVMASMAEPCGWSD